MEGMANSWSIPPADADDSPSWEGASFLECERDHWGNLPGKEDIVFEKFGIGLAAYYHRLHRHARSRDALVYDAHLARAIVDAADNAVFSRLSRQGGER